MFFVSRLGALTLIGTVTLIAAEGGGPTCKRELASRSVAGHLLKKKKRT